jgi:hypothetical protein
MDNKALADFIRVELSSVTSALNKLAAKIATLVNGPRKLDETGIAPQNTHENEGNPAGGELLSSAHIAPAPCDSKKPQESWYKRMEGWKTALEIAAIPFAIGYAFVTYFQ